jgi:osmotically inducible lipoprotein OsmB
MHRTLLSLSLAAAVLAGCGNTLGEQALFGAGAGALGSAAVGGDPLLGAAVGAGGNILICQTNQRNCRR